MKIQADIENEEEQKIRKSQEKKTKGERKNVQNNIWAEQAWKRKKN